MASSLVSPICKLPPFEVKAVFGALSEQVDHGAMSRGIPDVWKQTEGEGITICNCDTGTLPDHPDIAENLIDARDFTNSRSGPIDRNGHGTHTQTIHSAPRNDQGLIGIANKSRFRSAKVLDDNGSGSDHSVAAGIYWGIDTKSDIITLSLGSPYDSARIAEAVRAANDAGIFVICAAGNDGRPDSVNSPARLPQTIAVAATDDQGRAARFSSRGMQVDVAAPGVNVLGGWLNNTWARISGTSQATPFVTGVVALMLAKHRKIGGETPIRNNDELRAHLRDTADHGGRGHTPELGWGLINPEAMLPSKAEQDAVATAIPWYVTMACSLAGLKISQPARAGDAFSATGR